MNTTGQPNPLTASAPAGAGHGRLVRLILLSLGLHLAVLALWPRETPQQLQVGGEGMVVRLAPVVARSDDTTEPQSPAPTPAAPAPTIAVPATPQASDTTAEPAPAPPIARTARPVPQAVSAADEPAVQDSAAGGSASGTEEPAPVADSALRSAMTLQLQDELARHFIYPPLARKRGWQGEVLLAFQLESDGRILDARIARSSGYGMLDRAALDSLGRVGRLHHPPPRGIAMELPVVYRLEG